jgi:hypothetical protein
MKILGIALIISGVAALWWMVDIICRDGWRRKKTFADYTQPNVFRGKTDGTSSNVGDDSPDVRGVS